MEGMVNLKGVGIFLDVDLFQNRSYFRNKLGGMDSQLKTGRDDL